MCFGTTFKYRCCGRKDYLIKQSGACDDLGLDCAGHRVRGYKRRRVMGGGCREESQRNEERELEENTRRHCRAKALLEYLEGRRPLPRTDEEVERNNAQIRGHQNEEYAAGRRLFPGWTGEHIQQLRDNYRQTAQLHPDDLVLARRPALFDECLRRQIEIDTTGRAITEDDRPYNFVDVVAGTTVEAQEPTQQYFRIHIMSRQEEEQMYADQASTGSPPYSPISSSEFTFQSELRLLSFPEFTNLSNVEREGDQLSTESGLIRDVGEYMSYLEDQRDVESELVTFARHFQIIRASERQWFDFTAPEAQPGLPLSFRRWLSSREPSFAVAQSQEDYQVGDRQEIWWRMMNEYEDYWRGIIFDYEYHLRMFGNQEQVIAFLASRESLAANDRRELDGRPRLDHAYAESPESGWLELNLDEVEERQHESWEDVGMEDHDESENGILYEQMLEEGEIWQNRGTNHESEAPELSFFQWTMMQYDARDPSIPLQLRSTYDAFVHDLNEYRGYLEINGTAVQLEDFVIRVERTVHADFEFVPPRSEPQLDSFVDWYESWPLRTELGQGLSAIVAYRFHLYSSQNQEDMRDFDIAVEPHLEAARRELYGLPLERHLDLHAWIQNGRDAVRCHIQEVDRYDLPINQDLAGRLHQHIALFQDLLARQQGPTDQQESEIWTSTDIVAALLVQRQEEVQRCLELRLEEDRIRELHLTSLRQRVLGDVSPRSPARIQISVDEFLDLAYDMEPDEDNETARAEWAGEEQQRRSQRE
jgi:hypothetical protein